MPLDKQKYISLDKNQVQALDQFLFRFSKLQDVIGRKLFKYLLIFQEGDNLLIERNGYNTNIFGLDENGKCLNCKTEVIENFVS